MKVVSVLLAVPIAIFAGDIAYTARDRSVPPITTQQRIVARVTGISHCSDCDEAGSVIFTTLNGEEITATPQRSLELNRAGTQSNELFFVTVEVTEHRTRHGSVFSRTSKVIAFEKPTRTSVQLRAAPNPWEDKN
jgi:hypothetical protein